MPFENFRLDAISLPELFLQIEVKGEMSKKKKRKEKTAKKKNMGNCALRV